MTDEESIRILNLWMSHQVKRAEIQFLRVLERAGAPRRVLSPMKGSNDFLMYFACKRRGVAVPPYPADENRTPSFAAARIIAATRPRALLMAARNYAEERDQIYSDVRAAWEPGIAREFVSDSDVRAVRAAIKLLGSKTEI